ncbi:serine/threonine protein kinase [Mycolicibacterium sphagni]|uniref:non-specific serine/threonine protein kinase n=1 Tax=Mycolicibacterium sphagni TaxID=1786 RepID=A0ABX2JTL3_9MYCO|nr:serine/threonine protein kinase [Mycolicibacterium sphagni]
MRLTSGEHFAGFRVIESLGAGGMGEVYLVEHPRLPRREALKVLSADFTTNEEFRQRFLREAELASALWHPNLVTIHDRGEAEGRLWISMDYVDGADAANLVRRRYPTGMPVDQVIAIVTAVASALDAIHAAGMLHRDVKPANILCSEPTSGVRRIALADFGIARQINDSSGITATNTTIGTVSYAAPEQLMGKRSDGRADQYALAATAFHLLTGAAPFVDSNPAVVITQHLHASPPRLGDVRPELSQLDATFARAMAKDPVQRFASCSDFAAALAGAVDRVVVEGGNTMATPVSVPTFVSPPPQPAAWQSVLPPTDPKAAPGSARKSPFSPVIVVLTVLGLGLIAAVAFVGWQLANRQERSALAPAAPPSATPTAAPTSPQSPVTVTVSAPPSATAATPMLLADADIHGFVGFGGDARCSGGDRAIVVMRTPESALVVCKSQGGGAYYRGLRLSDMATIELTNIAVTDSGSTIVVTNNSDGTRYEISKTGLQIVKNGQVLGSESAIEFATP